MLNRSSGTVRQKKKKKEEEEKEEEEKKENIMGLRDHQSP